MIFVFGKGHEWWPFQSGDITIEFDFALAGWMQGRRYVRISYRSVVRCVRMGVVWIQAYEFTGMGVLHFCYVCTSLHVWTGVVRLLIECTS